MKITEVRIEELVLPKKDKDWKFALAANPATEGWIVNIRSEDGTVGYGYASTMNHYGAPHEAVKGALDRLSKRLIGRDSREIASILDDLDQVMMGNNQAKSGIDCALHDLRARQLGVPLCDLFGGPAVREFASLRILPIKSPIDMAKNARALADKGVRHFKIKVHGEVEEDVERVRAIRAELGPDAHLTIDANQSYAAKDAIRALNLMAPYKIDLAEQPVEVKDLVGLKAVTQAVPITVEADEAAYSLDQVDDPGARSHRRRDQPEDHQARRSEEDLCRRANLRRRRREVSDGRACRADAARGARHAFGGRAAGHLVRVRAFRVRRFGRGPLGGPQARRRRLAPFRCDRMRRDAESGQSRESAQECLTWFALPTRQSLPSCRW